MERKITIEEEGQYREDYQIRMLKENQIDGILTVRGRGMDDKSCYDYTVSGKISMKALYEKNEISSKELKKFLETLLKIVKEVERYLLNIHCILLEPEYIFCDDDQYYFCYYPLGQNTIWEEFHKMTEYLVKRADYKDRECAKIVGYLHKETMRENYSLEKVICECLTENEEQNGNSKPWKREASEESYVNDISECDWAEEQEMGNIFLKETDNLWLPVKKFLNRHRKPKWGDWDGLYIEEE